MHLLLICTLFSLFDFINSECSTTTTLPILLTGIINEAKKPIAYSPQCVEGSAAAGGNKSYGLTFRLPNDTGRCDDGLLICYPPMLENSAGGNLAKMIAVKGQFKIDNIKNNAAQSCKKYWQNVQKDGTKIGPAWHGINVYTKLINGNRHIRMQMSFSSKDYNFGPNHRHLSLHFGNGSSIFTYANENGGEALNGTDNDDKLLGTSFLKSARNGSFLRDFVGLWALGIDMLPPAVSMPHSINLYIYRGCNCSMEAWFTRPTDSEAPTERELTAGTTNCSKNTNGIAEIDYSVKGECAFNITGLTDENAESIAMELFEDRPADRGSDQLLLLATFSLGIHNENKITFTKSAPNISKRLSKGSNKLRLTIELHTYSFSIRINDNLLKDYKQFWPAENWWNGLGDKIKVKVEGQMMLLDDPTLCKINDKPQPTVTLPFVTKLQEQVVDGASFTFRVKLDDTKEFNILLLHDRPDFHDYIGATILHMKINPKIGINFEVFYYGKLQSNELAFKNYSFNASQPYDFRIKMYNKQYEVILNGLSFKNYSNSMPIWTTNFVRVQGNVSLLAEPEIRIPAKLIKKGQMSIQLTELLNYGDQINIIVDVNDAESFQIDFMHESSEFNEMIGDTLLRLVFNINDRSLKCSHYLHMIATFVNCSDALFTKHEFKQRDRRQLQILVAPDGFYGRIDGKAIQKLCQYYKPINQSVATMPIPPWAIDHIQIVGNVLVSDVGKVEASPQSWSKSVAWKERILFTRIDTSHGQGLLGSGERILILLKLISPLSTKPFGVEINLFNEALAFHDLIGKTVLKVELSKNRLSFNSYYNKKWLISTGNTSLTFTVDLVKSTTELKFVITASDAGFGLVLNGKDTDIDGRKLFFPGNIPAWAVQYITVKHDGIQLNGKPIVTCEPKERCI